MPNQPASRVPPLVRRPLVVRRLGGRLLAVGLAIALGLASLPMPVTAQSTETAVPAIPILVPITGFLSLEGTSQRNGALLALEQARATVPVDAPVIDTGTSPELAVTALSRALEHPRVVAVGASMLGTQMLAMLPVAAAAGVPLVTVSGTAKVTELGNPYVFRFFPADPVAKAAHARYVVEELGRRRVAMLTQTTAYGQSGRAHLLALFDRLGAEVVFEDALDTGVRDMVPMIIRALQAGPDVFVLHLHAGPTALFVRQAKGLGVGVPIVAGSAMHQPSTAALLTPAELGGVCAETASSPVSAASPALSAFTAAYKERFDRAPDAFALGQYDGVNMVLAALADGARTAEQVRAWLAGHSYRGVAMTYRSDGRGNMAHSAVIICYEGDSRTPRVVRRYQDLDAGG